MSTFHQASLLTIAIAGGCAAETEATASTENDGKSDSVRSVLLPPVSEASGETNDYVIEAADIDGTVLTVDVSYTGCAQHAWSLTWYGSFVSTTSEVGTAVDLLHDSQGDDCTESVSSRLRFDLGEIALQSARPVALKLHGGGPDGTDQKALLLEGTGTDTYAGQPYILDEAEPSLDFTLEDAWRTGDRLYVDVRFQGGCGSHDWKLYWAAAGNENAIEGEAPSTVATLVHETQSESCTAAQGKTLAFDIADIRNTPVDDMVLVVAGGTTKAGEPASKRVELH